MAASGKAGLAPARRNARRVEEQRTFDRAFPASLIGDLGDAGGVGPIAAGVADRGHRVATHERELRRLVDHPAIGRRIAARMAAGHDHAGHGQLPGEAFALGFKIDRASQTFQFGRERGGQGGRLDKVGQRGRGASGRLRCESGKSSRLRRRSRNRPVGGAFGHRHHQVLRASLADAIAGDDMNGILGLYGGNAAQRCKRDDAIDRLADGTGHAGNVKRNDHLPSCIGR